MSVDILIRLNVAIICLFVSSRIGTRRRGLTLGNVISDVLIMGASVLIWSSCQSLHR